MSIPFGPASAARVGGSWPLSRSGRGRWGRGRRAIVCEGEGLAIRSGRRPAARLASGAGRARVTGRGKWAGLAGPDVGG